MEQRQYFLYVAIFFVAILMISNTVGVKLVQIGPFAFAGATFIFPISYVFNDILTEVYGYRASRRIIWAGFAALVLMSAAYLLVGLLPAAPFWSGQDAYMTILGFAPRVVAASVVAYFVGEFCNAYILSRMKVRMKGKQLWVRLLASTLMGEALDTLIFTFVAFYGTVPLAAVWTIVVSVYLFKVIYEAIALPFTYMAVRWLKKKEQLDVYDETISYNPFRG